MKAALDLPVKIYKGIMDTHALYISTTLPKVDLLQKLTGSMYCIAYCNPIENKVQL